MAGNFDWDVNVPPAQQTRRLGDGQAQPGHLPVFSTNPFMNDVGHVHGEARAANDSPAVPKSFPRRPRRPSILSMRQPQRRGTVIAFVTHASRSGLGPTRDSRRCGWQ